MQIFHVWKMECPLCQSVLNRSNLFGLLQCGHSFCTGCIEELMSENSKCASCQTPFQAESIGRVSKNLAYSSMIILMQVHSCSACEDDHPATQKCVDCNDYFCELTAKIHLRLKTNINHQMISVQDFDKTQSNHLHLKYLQFKACPKHNRPFEYLNLNCRTHNHLLCSDCLIGDLPSLNLVRLGESSAPLMEEKLEHIRELGNRRSKHLSELREEEALLSSRLLEVAESKARSLREIRGVFVSLREALDVRERLLEQEVEDLSKSVSFSLQEERERSRVWQGQLSVLGECVEELEAWIKSVQTQSQVQSDLSSVSSSSSSQFVDSLPSSPLLPSTSTPSSTFSKSLDKSLMVDVCLLEDALLNALSSSQDTCSLSLSTTLTSFSLDNDMSSKRARLEVEERDLEGNGGTFRSCHNINEMDSHHSDRIDFTFCLPSILSNFTSNLPSSSSANSNSFLTLFLEGISELGSVSSSSSTLPPPVDWSVGSPHHVLSFYSEGEGIDQLYHPFSLAYSPVSKLFYVADSENYRIQLFRINPQTESEGRLEIEYLPPFISSLDFRSPSCVCYHEGLLFIAELMSHRIQVCREDGSVVRRLGRGKIGSEDGEMAYPSCCIVHDNHLFVADQGINRIQKFSLPSLTHVLSFGSFVKSEGQLSELSELVIFNGKLYVADSQVNRISVFDPDTGSELYVIGPTLSNGETLLSPCGLLVSHNLLFVSGKHHISVFNLHDHCLYSFGSRGDGIGQFTFAMGMVMVGERLFVCDNNNHRIQVFEMTKQTH